MFAIECKAKTYFFYLKILDYAILPKLDPFLSYHLKPKRRKNIWLSLELNLGEQAPQADTLCHGIEPLFNSMQLYAMASRAQPRLLLYAKPDFQPTGVRTWLRSSGWTGSKSVSWRWSRRVSTSRVRTWPSTFCQSSATAWPCCSTRWSRGNKGCSNQPSSNPLLS